MKTKIEYLKVLRIICIKYSHETINVLEAKAGRTVLKAREISTAPTYMRLEVALTQLICGTALSAVEEVKGIFG